MDTRTSNADPKIPLKCPKCGTVLIYVRSEGPADIYQATHFYRCAQHGVGSCHHPALCALMTRTLQKCDTNPLGGPND
jgi:hypothetical protein